MSVETNSTQVNENQEIVENQENQEDTSNEQSEQKDYVPLEKYQSTSKDLLKWKQKARENEQALQDIRRQQEEAKKKQLAENEEWKTLAEKYQQELDEVKQQYESERDNVRRQTKMSAVLSNLDTGFKRPEYNQFIQLDKIHLDESGSVDKSSVKAEVERIKQEHPELLKRKQATPAPSSAPRPQPSDKPMTMDQLARNIGEGIVEKKSKFKSRNK